MSRSGRFRFLYFAALLAIACVSGLWAADRPSTGAEGFQEFEMILVRNIFDPNRRPATRASNDEPTHLSEPAETVDLLGTWITDRQTVAFVEGSRSEFSGTRIEGGTVGGWRVLSIKSDFLILENDGKRLEWPVGQRIERNGDGVWVVSGNAVLSSAPSATASASSTSEENEDDLLKKMRERRQREIDQ